MTKQKTTHFQSEEQYMTEKNFTKHLKENEDRLIVFGTGEQGERIAKSLQQNDIVPACFCDNNKEKIGKQLESVRICSFEEIVKQYKNPIFLISPYLAEFQKQIIQQIKSADFPALEYYTLDYFYQYIEKAYTESPHEMKELYDHKMKSQKSPTATKTYLDFLSFPITYRCSLRCRDCGNFVVYQKNPIDFKKEDLFAWLDRLDELFDCISLVRILGGEPFLHKDLFEIANYAATKSAIKTIDIVTNGTILPKKEDLMKLKLNQKKIVIVFSNYGELSTQLIPFGQMLDEVGINWVKFENQQWLHCTHVQFRNKNEDELIDTYKGCLQACPQLVHGKLFYCGFVSVATEILYTIPKKTQQCVNLMDTNKNKVELQQEIRDLYYGAQYLEACNWCKGRTEKEAVWIPPAVQTNKLLHIEQTYLKEYSTPTIKH